MMSDIDELIREYGRAVEELKSDQEKGRDLHCKSPSNRVIAQLNSRWRVINDPLQWILQVRKGSKTTKSTGWSGQSFCTERTALLRCIREYCGPVDPKSLRYLEELPDRHREYENKEN